MHDHLPFDPALEPPIRLQDVPRLKWIPGRRAGSRLNISTVFRWAGRGCRGVKLETIRIGGALCTSEEALKRFFARLSDSSGSPTATTSALRAKQIAKATAELDAAGY